MHHYPFHIGDYIAHTHHLSLFENLAYRLLLDQYYLTEKPLPDAPIISRLIGMREQVAEVDAVLQEFFVQTDDGWVNKRAEKEIEFYHARLEAASRGGKASAESRAKSKLIERPLNSGSSGLEVDLSFASSNQNQNQNQNHNQNLKPEPIKPKVKPAGAEAPAWLPASWQTYTQHRKESRKPLTATAQTAAINKLERWKAEGKDISAIITQSVENGWSGLFEVKQGVGQAKPSIAPPKLSCCVCGGILRGFTETSQGKMCGTCWDKR